MPVADLMIAGFKLLGLGMGIVFFFLVLLVFTMQGMSRFARLIEGSKPSLPGERVETDADIERPADELISVIAAAVSRYRATHR